MLAKSGLTVGGLPRMLSRPDAFSGLWRCPVCSSQGSPVCLHGEALCVLHRVPSSAGFGETRWRKISFFYPMAAADRADREASLERSEGGRSGAARIELISEGVYIPAQSLLAPLQTHLPAEGRRSSCH